MNILLFGASGQVGSEVYNLLSKKNSVHRFTSSELDIRDKVMIHNVFADIKPNFVINTAAFTDVRQSEENQFLARSINVDGVQNIALACKEFSSPLCHLSSDYVFTGNQKAHYKEDDATGPVNLYGQTKLDGEELIKELLEEHLIIRTSWVFGNGQNFVNTMIKQANDNKELSIIDNQFGGPTSAIAIAKCIKKMIEHYSSNLNMPWGTYHFCGKPKTNWNEFAKKIFAAAKKKRLIKNIPDINQVSSDDFIDKVNRPANSYLDCSKIFLNFNINQPSWKSDLESYLDDLTGG